MPGQLRQVPGMEPPADLSSFLSGLKASGCTLLVTGDIDPATRAAVSRRLFGVPEDKLHADETRRKRVLVQTEQALSPHQYLPFEVEDTSAMESILDATEADRSSATMDPSSDGPDSLDSSPPTGLDEVATAVERRVNDLLDGVVDPAPAELRIGCSSLLSLEKRFTSDDVVAFANSLASIARENRGMCHLHYPKADAAPLVPRLSTVVNARLEVATVGSSIYVTWHTPYDNVDDAERPIDWFDMTED